MEESGWHHFNPPVNHSITKGGTAEHGGFHDVMYPYEVSPNKLESESVDLTTGVQEVQRTEEKIRENNQPN